MSAELGTLKPTIVPSDRTKVTTRILVGEDRQMVWATAGTLVQVSVHDLDGKFKFVLATAEHGFSYEAAIAAYDLLKKGYK